MKEFQKSKMGIDFIGPSCREFFSGHFKGGGKKRGPKFYDQKTVYAIVPNF